MNSYSIMTCNIQNNIYEEIVFAIMVLCMRLYTFSKKKKEFIDACYVNLFRCYVPETCLIKYVR